MAAPGFADAIHRRTVACTTLRPHLPSMSSPATAARGTAVGPGFPEFVCLIAMLMALNALAIDAMLPALPQIGDGLGVVTENSRQWVITAYLLGFGVA